MVISYNIHGDNLILSFERGLIMKKFLSYAAAFAVSLSALSCPLKPVYNYNYSYTVTASAEESNVTYGTYENLEYYKYTDDYGSYIIITYCDESAEEVVIPSEIEGSPVLEIDVGAFRFNENLKSVTIPDSVKYIEDQAFAYCTNLTNITFPKELYSIGSDAFYDTPWLENKRAEDPLVIVSNIVVDGKLCSGKVTIPDTVTNICEDAFRNCTDMTEVIISENVEQIYYGVFAGCTGLTEVTLPNSIFYIYYNAFAQCTNLETVNIPKSVRFISGYAFEGTPWLENMRAKNPLVVVNYTVIDGKTCEGEVEIPEDVRAISEYAFDGNNTMTSLTIPENTYDLDWNSLINCSQLKEVTILNPNAYIKRSGLSNYAEWDGEIGEYTYYYDGIIRGYENSTAQEYAEENGYTFESLGEAPEIGGNNEEIYGEYENLIYYKYTDEDESYIIITNCVDSPESVVIPSEIDGTPVISIGDYAFTSNKNLISVTIPDSVKYIESNAFSYCTNLTDITFPEELYNIGGDAFFETAWLKNKQAENPLVTVNNLLIDGTTCKGKVTIPNTVTDICTGAFYDCTELTDIIIPETVTFISYSAFEGCTGLTEITLPDSIYSIYGETFYRCTNLETINIPESVGFINGRAFEDTPWLENKRAENPLVIVNNILIDGKTCEGDVEIPEYVDSIGDYAFAGNRDITSVTIPENIYDLGWDSLLCCSNLKEVTILNPNAYIAYTGLSNFTEQDDITWEDVYYYEGIIRGYENSTAQQYAEENGITFESLGESPYYPGSDDLVYNGLYYRLFKDGIRITGFDDSSETVDIPDEIEGIPVREIDYYAFARKDITSVTIPDSIINIGAYAFAYCENLIDINIPDGLEYVGESAFLDTPWLENKKAEDPLVIENGVLIDGTGCSDKVTVPDSVYLIACEAFRDNSELTEIEIPDNVIILSAAFQNCSGLTEITLPNGLTDIYYNTFRGCTKLETIIIPESVTFFGGEAFEGTPWLENKRAENPLVIVNNSVIDGKMCTGAVEIPEGVVSLGEWAFYENENITSLTLPESLYETGLYSLYNCTGLNEITILNPYFEIENSYLSNYCDWNGETHEEILDYSGIIRGYDHSSAELFAITNGYTFESLGESPMTDILLGDVNGDGMIDSTDASDVLAEYSRIQTGAGATFTSAQVIAADVNMDGSIDSSDASKILAYYSDVSTGKTPSWD